MEKETTSNSVDAADEVILKVAKNLQGGFTKQTTGEPRKWRDVPPDEKKLWVRLARTARKVIVESDATAGA